MKSRVEVLIAYNEAVRELVNSKVQRFDKTFSQALRQLKLNGKDDWGFLCSSMDLIGDTSFAIQNFEKFKVNGPTRYDDTGEKYLRLYGFLNAVYLQQSAVLKMYKIFSLSNPNKFDDKIKKLKITILRHKLASHSINYKKDIKKNQKNTFVLSRMDLEGSKVTFINNSNNRIDKEDLLDLLRDHIELMIKALDKIYEKAFKTIYENNKDKIKEFSDKIRLLRHEKKGNLVVKIPESKNTLIFRSGSRGQFST